MITSRLWTTGRSLCLIAALCAVSAGPARADEFSMFRGKAAAIWKTTIVLGGAFRNASPQPDLVGAGAGQPGSNLLTGGVEFPGATGAVGVNDDSDLNFRKGDLVSAPVTLMSDFRLQFKTSGIFVRVRAWYDMALESKSVYHGNTTAKYAQGVQLDDTNFTGASKFKGVEIYDAFYYGNYNVGAGKLQLRVGRQAVSWGEGLFYPGINAFAPMDASWLVMPGATVVNGGQIPVARLYGNVALPRGWAVEGFYNLEFRYTNIPGCGTWYSMVDNAMQPGCNVATAGGMQDIIAGAVVKTRSYFEGKLPAGGWFPNGGPDCPQCTKAPKWQDSGWGTALHTFIEPLRSELGFYYTQYTNPLPNVTTLPSANPVDFAVNNTFVGGIKSWAVSLSSGVRDMALSGQFTRTLGLPGNGSFPTIIQGAMQGIGPYADQSQYIGQEYKMYYRFNISQMQAGFTAQVGQFMHLSNAQLVGEVDMQWATNHPGMEKVRIGRYGNFGVATWNGGNCSEVPDKNGVVNKCAIEGFGTPFAMGYRLRWMAGLPTSRHGVTWTPILSFGQDPTGYSIDGSIVGGRTSYGALLRADIRQRYFLELGATAYGRHAEFDPMRDRGVYTVNFGINLQ